MGFFDDAVGFITDPFRGDTVDAWKYDDKAGKDAIRRQTQQAQGAATAQAYALAASQPGGGMSSPAALRSAQMAGAQSQQAIGQQGITAQQQYSQQMEMARGQAAMQAQTTNAQLDQARDSSIMGMAGAALGGLALASDPRVKQNVQPVSGPPDIYEFGSQRAAEFGEGSPRPTPQTISEGSALREPWMRARREALAPQPTDQRIGVEPSPGNRFLTSNTGAGFGRDYGFTWGDVSNTLRDQNEQNVMRQHAVEQGLDPDEIGLGGGVSDVAAAGNAPSSDPSAAPDTAGEGALKGLIKGGMQLGSQGSPSYTTVAKPQLIDFGPPIGSGIEQKQNVEPLTPDARQLGVPADENTVVQGGKLASLRGQGALTHAAAELPVYSWEYKPEIAEREGVPQGHQFATPMANGPGGMESNPAYGPAVFRDEKGMGKVDPGRAAMQNIAVTTDNAREIERLKGQLARVAPQAIAQNTPPPQRSQRPFTPQRQGALESIVEEETAQVMPGGATQERAGFFRGAEVPEGKTEGELARELPELSDEYMRSPAAAPDDRSPAGQKAITQARWKSGWRPSNTDQPLRGVDVGGMTEAQLARMPLTPSGSSAAHELGRRNLDEPAPDFALTPEEWQEIWARGESARPSVEASVGDYAFEMGALNKPRGKPSEFGSAGALEDAREEREERIRSKNPAAKIGELWRSQKQEQVAQIDAKRVAKRADLIRRTASVMFRGTGVNGLTEAELQALHKELARRKVDIDYDEVVDAIKPNRRNRPGVL
jgi:hypothetical protein